MAAGGRISGTTFGLATFGLVGALAAFPRRLAAREVERQGGRLRRGVTRRTRYVVFGRRLLERAGEAEIEARCEAECKSGRELLSENGFLRLLGLAEAPQGANLGETAVLEQSRLVSRDLALLSLFDAFEADSAPYVFRDVILARKYAGLVAEGATWSTIARSVQRRTPGAPLTALSLHADRGARIYARHGAGLSELDGQQLLPFEETDDTALDDLFAEAEDAEAVGRFEEVAALYQRCLTIDPRDSVAAFNRANCLAAAGDPEAAAASYLDAARRDPSFVEPWFNLGCLTAKRSQPDAARRHLQKAVALDADYADAVYNLATLEYDAGNLPEARRWWARYLELDSGSEWARTAARGVRYVDIALAHSAG